MEPLLHLLRLFLDDIDRGLYQRADSLLAKRRELLQHGRGILGPYYLNHPARLGHMWPLLDHNCRLHLRHLQTQDSSLPRRRHRLFLPLPVPIHGSEHCLVNFREVKHSDVLGDLSSTPFDLGLR